MSIARLLSGQATEAVDMNVVKTFLKDRGGVPKKIKKQAKNFAQRAQQSKYGGAGTSFEKMTAAQQREFIENDAGFVAKKMRGPSASTAPPPPPPPRSPQNTPPQAPPSNVGGNQPAPPQGSGGGSSPPPPPTNTGGGGGGGTPPTPTTPITQSAVNAQPGDPNLLQQIWRGVAGDTSGRASVNAAKTFNQAHQDVFSSKATAEAFGLGDDVAPLQAAFGKTGDDFSTPLQRAGLDEKQIAGLQKFQDEVAKVKGEGGQLSEEGMQSMLKNQAELGNMYGGFSRAGATASPNAILRGLGGEGTGGEALLGIAAVGGLAGAANVAMGGDFVEGAAVGGGAAFAGRALAKGVAGSMGDIEQSMMKSILGDDMATAGAREVPAGEVIESVTKGTKLTEMSARAQRELTMEDVNPNFAQAGGAKMSVEDYVTQMGGTTRMKTKQDAEYIYEATKTEQVTGAQARRENLTSIKDMKDNDERLQGFGKKKMRELLDPGKKKNVAMNNRALVLGGGMLSGVAFTGTADKRDYRRGFNANRGNRI